MKEFKTHKIVGKLKNKYELRRKVRQLKIHEYIHNQIEDKKVLNALKVE